MSFFTKGFAGMKKKTGSKTAKDKKEDKKDKGRWDMHTDAYGRTYWQHSVTGEWSYAHRAALVPPVATVNPSPMGYAAGPAVFTPSPVPAGYVFGGFGPPKKGKSGDKKKGNGGWETMYDDDGDKFWEHTVTKKKTYKDPYY